MYFDKEKFLRTVKQYSYFSHDIDWNAYEKKLKKVPNQLTKIDPVNDLLREIDHHSFAVFNESPGEETASHHNHREKSVISKSCDKETGLLKLQGFYCPTNNPEHLYKNYTDIVSALQKIKDKKYLILDLSENTGGNMYPWFAALAPLYETKILGYFQYSYKEKRDAWKLKKDGVYCGDTKWFDAVNHEKYHPEKIAALISKETTSSGEALAMSLKSQKNVKLFGERTAGYTTGNEEFVIGDIRIWLSTGMMQDKERQSYLDGVTPDISSTNSKKSAQEWFAE
ncbi:MAG TPA: S41 family peptidase [Candidatus Paceibacterota bacterium]|nr:S41 family peptidase [Candidatus Paceibacterota bacterium]